MSTIKLIDKRISTWADRIGVLDSLIPHYGSHSRNYEMNGAYRKMMRDKFNDCVDEQKGLILGVKELMEDREAIRQTEPSILRISKKENAMKEFIGTKRLKAEPMNKGEYNKYRGWEHPENEDPLTEGYLVEYLDGGKPNDERHNGYISWSPKETFEKAYRESGKLSFGLALESIKAGKKLARKGWNGKGMFIFLVAGSTFKVNRPPLLGIYEEGTEIKYHAHIDMKTADGQVVPWLASQTDVLAEDYHIVD